MGHLHTTVVVARFGGEEGQGGGGDGADEGSVGSSETAAGGAKKTGAAAAKLCPYRVLAVRSEEGVGAFSFDLRMFQHFAEEVGCMCFFFGGGGVTVYIDIRVGVLVN